MVLICNYCNLIQHFDCYYPYSSAESRESLHEEILILDQDLDQVRS